MKVGVLGGGQLGQMMALAGYPLGLDFRFFDPSPEACAGRVGELVNGKFEDPAALDRFAGGLDVVTYEWENVPVDAVNHLAKKLPVFPGATALKGSQDRLSEKSMFASLGIDTAKFIAVDKESGLSAAVDRLGLPCVLKTRRFGYDGLGQYVIRSEADLEPASKLLSVPCILEAFVDFDREVSIIAARGRGGETVFYPLVQNEHRGGILRVTTAPAPNLTPGLQAAAESIATRLLDALEYTGVITVELFQKDGRLLANETAPRVHNSGHWTIEGAATSQFENHLRAITGLPLGSTEARGHSIMLNLIGNTPPIDMLLQRENTNLHLYGKAPRPGRKLGHLTLTGDDAASLETQARELRALIALHEA